MYSFLCRHCVQGDTGARSFSESVQLIGGGSVSLFIICFTWADYQTAQFLVVLQFNLSADTDGDSPDMVVIRNT